MKSSFCVNLINYEGVEEDEQTESSSSIRQRDDDEEVNARSDAMKKRTKTIPKILDGKYFVIKLREGDRVQAIYKLCGALRWGSIKGTGNFTRHINDNHKDRVEDMQKYIKQGKEMNVNDNKQPTLKAYTAINNDQVCGLLLDLIIDSNLLFRFVESKSLKELLNKVAGRKISTPSITKIMSTLDSRLKAMKTKLITELGRQQRVCLTADIWSHMKKSYLGVSVYYIDEHWKRQSHILEFRYLNKRHTYDYLAQVLKSILDEYILPVEKISHIITDGESNFCKAFRVFGRQTDFNESLIELDEMVDVDTTDEISNMDANIEEADVGNEVSDDDAFEREALEAITESNIQATQIDFPDPADIDNEIVLPPQMRCFAHLLNLIGNYLNVIDLVL